jgi:hypothetical protein
MLHVTKSLESDMTSCWDWCLVSGRDVDHYSKMGKLQFSLNIILEIIKYNDFLYHFEHYYNIVHFTFTSIIEYTSFGHVYYLVQIHSISSIFAVSAPAMPHFY